MNANSIMTKLTVVDGVHGHPNKEGSRRKINQTNIILSIL